MAASAETSLTSISRVRLRQLVEQKVPQAILIERLHHDPNAYLSTILIVNTVAIIVASSTATLLALHLYQERVAEWAVSLVLSLVVLVACEITPKTLALQRAEKVALRMARLVAWATLVMRPIVFVLTVVTRLILRIMGAKAQVRGPFVTEEELKMLVSVGEEEGVLEEEEREMIHGIFEMGDMRVREVMVPRTDLVAIEVNEPVEKAVDLVTKHGHTRIPVYESNLDHIVGVLYAKDLLGAAPKVGATLKLGNAELRVEAVQGTRIKKVRIRSEAPFEVPHPQEGEAFLTSTPESSPRSETKA